MKPSLLLLHGAIGSQEQLKPLAEQLKNDFNVALFNFAGHGGHADVDRFTIKIFTDQTVQYIRQNNLAPAAIFGYSMGGYVATYLAVHYPELVTCVCTLATKFYWDAGIAAREVKMLDANTIAEKFPAFAATLQQRHGPDNWRNVLEKTVIMLQDMGNQSPLQADAYAAIQKPVLLMLGDRDKMVSIEETVQVYKTLPNAQLAILPKTPHPIEQVDIAQVQFQIKRFLGNLQGQRTGDLLGKK